MAKAITINQTMEDGSVTTDTQEVTDAKNVFVRHIDETQSEVFYQNENDEMISLGVKSGMVSVHFGELQPTEVVQSTKTKKSKSKK